MVLANTSLLWAFTTTFIEMSLLSVSGSLLGIALEKLLRVCGWIHISITVFLRTVSWVPFFVFFALPLQSNNTVLAVSIMGTVVVGLHTCSYLHSLRTENPRDWRRFVNEVAKCTILRALLFCLFTQVRSQTGWIQLFNQEPGVDVIFSAMIALTVFLFFLNQLLRYNFHDNTRAYASILKAELTMKKSVSFLLLVAISLLCFVLWQLAGEYLRTKLAGNTALGVFGWLSHLVTGGYENVAGNLGKDFFISSLEIWGGVFVSGGLSFFLAKVLSNESIVARLIAYVVSITFVTPIILPMLLPFFGINRVGDFSLSTMISIAGLTLFPSSKVVWALRDCHGPVAAIVGFKVALPFAYVAMLVGELYGAVAGLGFRIVSEQASGNPLGALAVSFMTLISLLLSISVLHWFTWLSKGPD